MRDAAARACSHDGCGGVIECKPHYIGQCRKPDIMAMRVAFAVEYGTETTGGTFLPHQVVDIMAHDSSSWNAILTRVQTEAAVQTYLGDFHRRSGH